MYKIFLYLTTLISFGSFIPSRVSAADFNKTLKSFLPSDPTNADLGSIEGTIEKITIFALDIAGLVAFIMILYASIMYLTSYGEESKAEIAKKTLMWSIIGILAVMFARSIIMVVYNILKN